MAARVAFLAVAPAAVLASWNLPFNKLAPTDNDDCNAAGSILSTCDEIYPGFTDVPLAELAACVCCDGQFWDPSYFDGPADSCYTYLSDEEPGSTDLIDDYFSIRTFCDLAGSVPCTGGGVTGATATPTDDAPTLTQTSDQGQITGSAGCDSARSMIEVCSSKTVSFDDTDAKAAECLCYDDDSEWLPDKFDGYVGRCLSWASTASSEFYSTVRSIEGFCETIGEVVIDTDSVTEAVITPTTGLGNGGGGGGGIGGLASSTRTIIVSPTSTDNAPNLVSPGGNGRIASFFIWLLGFYIAL